MIQQIETIVKEGLDKNLLRKRSNANTFQGRLLSMIQKARKEHNFETAMFIQSIYKIYQEYKSNKINSIDIIGWKGKDEIQIYKDFEDDFRIIEHRKDKEGEVENIYKEIPKENVNYIKNLLGRILLKGDSVPYVAIVRTIIEEKDLQINVDSFNGGKNRAKYYFPLYYYPVKCLEALGFVKYSSRGTITRLK